MAATTNVAVHTISFRGKAGIIFALLAGSLTLFVVAFSTVSWVKSNEGGRQEGLWENCTCTKVSGDDSRYAVQALLCIGLIGLLIALLLITIYLCLHTVSKNSTIIALVCVCFISFTFMLIAFIIYGIQLANRMWKDNEQLNLSWSYVVSVLSSVLCFAAGVVSIIQMRKSGVRM